MARIKAFRAIRPTRISGQADPALKSSLEPGRNDQGDLRPYLLAFRRLLQENYCTIEEEPAIYVYQHQNNEGMQTGIWAITNVEDSTNGTIIHHEQTLSAHENKIQAYRRDIGLEGHPILLTYCPNREVEDWIREITTSGQPELIQEGENVHRFWKVTSPSAIRILQHAFQFIEQVYLADGHHRLAAAEGLQQTEQQWISSLYVSAEQLKIREFNRVVIPAKEILRKELFELICQYFHFSPIPNNKPYQPDRNHRLGMCYRGTWYQLDLKTELELLQHETDTVILQNCILEPFFAITDPRTDPSLQTYGPGDGWEKLKQQTLTNANAIAFTLFPMTIDQLMDHADRQKPLPPKSTWIEPKIPYGMLMYCSRLMERNGIIL